MSSKNRLSFTALIAFCAIAAMTLSSQKTRAQPTPSVVVAAGIDPGYSHYVIAVKKGFFEKQGIKAELQSFDDGNVALDALLTGRADIGGTSELGALSRFAKGGRLYAVASGQQSPRWYGITGKSSIQSPKELEGKNIGVARASGGHLYLYRFSRYYGLDMNRMNIKFLQAPESVAALSRGDIDAFFLWDPWLTRAAATVPNTKIIARSDENNIHPLDTYVYFGQRLIDNPELAKKSLQAIIDAAEWIPANKDETEKIVGETYRLTPAEVGRILEGSTFNVHFSSALRKKFIDAGDFAKSVGIITDMPNLDAFLRPDILRAIAPERVKEN
jgi:NitT/TauT family transport system substrate-binding protein